VEELNGSRQPGKNVLKALLATNQAEQKTIRKVPTRFQGKRNLEKKSYKGKATRTFLSKGKKHRLGTRGKTAATAKKGRVREKRVGRKGVRSTSKSRSRKRSVNFRSWSSARGMFRENMGKKKLLNAAGGPG